MTTDERDRAQALARELYLELDTEGNRKYSYADIVAKIGQISGIEVSDETVRRWAIDDRWETLLQAAKNIGIQKALKEKETREESIKEAKANEIADLYKVNMAFFRGASKEIAEMLKEKRLTDRDLLWLFKTSGENVMRLHEMTKTSDDDKILELFERMNKMFSDETTATDS